MATYSDACPTCGAPVVVSVAQRVFQSQLVWSQSCRCDECGDTIEADGHGEPPKVILDALLAQDGEWELWLETTGSSTVQALRALREGLGLTIADVGKWKSRIPGAVTSGTRAQMEWLVTLLQRDGLHGTIKQREPTTL